MLPAGEMVFAQAGLPHRVAVAPLARARPVRTPSRPPCHQCLGESGWVCPDGSARCMDGVRRDIPARERPPPGGTCPHATDEARCATTYCRASFAWRRLSHTPSASHTVDIGTATQLMADRPSPSAV